MPIRPRIDRTNMSFNELEPEEKIERLRRLTIAPYRQQQLILTTLDCFRAALSAIYNEIGIEKLIPTFEQIDRLAEERLMQEHHNWTDLTDIAETWIRPADFI